MAQSSLAQRLVTVAVTVALTVVGATVLLLAQTSRRAEAATSPGLPAATPLSATEFGPSLAASWSSSSRIALPAAEPARATPNACLMAGAIVPGP